MKLNQIASATAALLALGVNASSSLQARCGRATAKCPVADVSAVKHTGEPVGREEVVDGLTLYISEASGAVKPNKAVLYITDVFGKFNHTAQGIQLPENKLLADSFARAGYLTVAPDLFDGSPAPGDINVPGFNTTEFLARHNETVTDPKVAAAIAYIRDTLGDDAAVGAVGYCFGGRYSFRFAAEGKGLDATFAAHPSLLQDAEISAAVKPASVAYAENDNLIPDDRRHAMEPLLKGTGIAYQTSLYSGTQHGFGVRADVSDPKQKYAKEEAFFQAVRWFDTWL